MADWLDALERLQKLKLAGVLTADEFESEKRKLLGLAQPHIAEVSRTGTLVSSSEGFSAPKYEKSEQASAGKMTLGLVAFLGVAGLLIKVADGFILTNPDRVRAFMQNFVQPKTTGQGLQINVAPQLPTVNKDGNELQTYAGDAGASRESGGSEIESRTASVPANDTAKPKRARDEFGQNQKEQIVSDQPRQVSTFEGATTSPVQAPTWTRKPNSDDYARFYPENAQRLEQEGAALVKCVVTTKGALVACQILSEEPAGFGFGEATKKVVSLWKMKPQTVNGEPVEATWQTRIRWQLP
jgi:hypothetical protein